MQHIASEDKEESNVASESQGRAAPRQGASEKF